LRSRELGEGKAGRRGNHLVLDDTAGKIQAQLKSDHQCSQLSLGHIARIEDTSGRKDARGEGWELRTDGHGVARAALGMLITTEARPNAASHIKDLGETVERLPIAGDIHEHLAETARLNSAQDSATQQGAVVDVIKKQNESMKGSATANDKFPELAKPHLVLSSPAGIATSTARSTHIASDGNTALTTGRSLSIASGDSLIASIRQTFRLVLAACIAMSSWPSESQAAPQASYKIRDSKPMKDASIQIVSFDSVAGLDQTAMKKINTALIAASAWFGREAKKCSTYAEGHPWGYELTLDKVLLSEKYLSVVLPSRLYAQGHRI
jgi:hypothetical protein